MLKAGVIDPAKVYPLGIAERRIHRRVDKLIHRRRL